MGIRFQCPNGHRLHVKNELAGQVGVCPHCQAKARIPRLEEGQQPTASGPQPLPEQAQVTEQPSASHPAEDNSTEPPLQTTQQPTAPMPLPKARPVAKAVVKPVTRQGSITSPPIAPSPSSPSTTPDQPAVSPEDSQQTEWRLQTETGEQLGPGDSAALVQWQRDGYLTDNAHLWRPGWDAWRRLVEVREELPLEPLVALPPQPREELAQAAKRYVSRRKLAAKRQKYVALILLGLVVVVAIVMAVVLSSMGEEDESIAPTPPPVAEKPQGASDEDTEVAEEESEDAMLDASDKDNAMDR